jgi:hypothetical protein
MTYAEYNNVTSFHSRAHIGVLISFNASDKDVARIVSDLNGMSHGAHVRYEQKSKLLQGSISMKQRLHRICRVVAAASFLAVAGQAGAIEVITGRVIVLESTYLPGAISFQLDTGNTTCPLGTWLKWQKPDASNNKATYATLLTAVALGAQVNFIINDNDTSCTGQFLHLLR